MKLVGFLVALLLAVTGCSSDGSSPSAEPTPPRSWIDMVPGDAFPYDGPGGELVLIYVDETYSMAGTNASALTWKHGDDYTTDYFVEDADGTLWWYGRRGSWRAGRNGEEPRELTVVDDQVTFGDRVITLSDDGPPSQLKTPDGTYTLAG